MQYSGMPNSKITELLKTSQRDFSLQELLQVASQLFDGEALYCSTPMTPIIRLVVSLDNKLERTDVVQVSLNVFNHAHMRFDLPFPLNNHCIQRAWIKGRRPVHPRALSIQDIIDIFEISDNAIWNLDKYRYPTADGGTCTQSVSPFTF